MSDPRITTTPRPELAALVAKLTEDCLPLLEAKDYRTVLSALSTVFAIATAGRSFAEGDSEEEQWQIAGNMVWEFRQIVPQVIAQHLADLRGSHALATPAVPETKQ